MEVCYVSHQDAPIAKIREQGASDHSCSLNRFTSACHPCTAAILGSSSDYTSTSLGHKSLPDWEETSQHRLSCKLRRDRKVLSSLYLLMSPQQLFPVL